MVVVILSPVKNVDGEVVIYIYCIVIIEIPLQGLGSRVLEVPHSTLSGHLYSLSGRHSL
jgi:hypothetical protein